jgi:hypothetical protein
MTTFKLSNFLHNLVRSEDVGSYFNLSPALSFVHFLQVEFFFPCLVKCSKLLLKDIEDINTLIM